MSVFHRDTPEFAAAMQAAIPLTEARVMNIDAIKESITNIYECLDRIADETEVRPGEETIRGTDGGVIDPAEILQAVDVARSHLRDIGAEISK